MYQKKVSREFILKNRFWFLLFFSSVFFVAFLLVLNYSISILSGEYDGLKVFFGISFSILAWWLFENACQFNDEAWYWLYYKKTGEDFEHRYCDHENINRHKIK